MSIIIETTVLNEDLWKDIKIIDLVNKVKSLMEKSFDFQDNSEISLLFCDDDKIQELNKLYRNKDKPTNVLSFALNDDGQESLMLGDICFSFNTIEREANEQNKEFDNHLIHLLIHGILHLIGCDHIEDDEADEMEKTEIELLKELNIENPYKN